MNQKKYELISGLMFLVGGLIFLTYIILRLFVFHKTVDITSFIVVVMILLTSMIYLYRHYKNK